MTPTTAEPISVRRGFDPSALAALFVLTLRQHIRGRKLIVLSALFLLPAILAAVGRFLSHPPPPGHLEFALLFNLIPHALVTLTALLYSAGIIQDEVEDQTLTYLLARPLPRWSIYITKLAVTFLVVTALTCVFTFLTMLVVHWNSPDTWNADLPGRMFRMLGLLTLLQAAYCGLFALLGMVTRYALIAGLAYIVAFEGFLTFQSVARQLTMIFYFRVLAMRWLNPPDGRAWDLNLDTVPSARGCVLTLLGVAAVTTLIGAVQMMRTEFRMKTPEGS